MFTRVNINRNRFFIKSLYSAINQEQNYIVDFFQPVGLTGIKVVSRRAEIMLKSNTIRPFSRLLIGVRPEITQETYLGAFGYEFCTFITGEKLRRLSIRVI